MITVLVYSVALLVAVLVSDLARRSVLSTAVLFLLAGFAVNALGIVQISADQPVVSRFSELALISVLFTDGMRSGIGDLARAWRLPGRALLLGMPLTCGLTALLAHGLVGLGWLHALLVGAVLSPTDPVFAAALVGNENVPKRLRRLLNVESGLNDGLALPLVMLMLGALGAGPVNMPLVIGDVFLGVAIGVVVPLIAIQLERTRYFSASGLYQPLLATAIFLLVYSAASITGANAFLGAFAAGVTIASISEHLREQFRAFAETAVELIKLAALLVFGMLISLSILGEIDLGGWAFVVLALVLVRPVAMQLALLGSGLSMRERMVAGWFGPRGFASVVFGLYVLHSSGLAHRQRLFDLIGVVVVTSIVAHSTTDVMAARWLKRQAAPVTRDDGLLGGPPDTQLHQQPSRR